MVQTSSKKQKELAVINQSRTRPPFNEMEHYFAIRGSTQEQAPGPTANTNESQAQKPHIQTGTAKPAPPQNARTRRRRGIEKEHMINDMLREDNEVKALNKSPIVATRIEENEELDEMDPKLVRFTGKWMLREEMAEEETYGHELLHEMQGQWEIDPKQGQAGRDHGASQSSRNKQ